MIVWQPEEITAEFGNLMPLFDSQSNYFYFEVDTIK